MYLAGASVGKVQLTRMGLYYEVKCTCPLKDGRMRNLIMLGESGTKNLGLLIPGNSGMELIRRIPAKYMETRDVANYLLNHCYI